MSIFVGITIESDTKVEAWGSTDCPDTVYIDDETHGRISIEFHDTAKGREFAAVIVKACDARDQSIADFKARRKS